MTHSVSLATLSRSADGSGGAREEQVLHDPDLPALPDGAGVPRAQEASTSSSSTSPRTSRRSGRC
ncbi:MAG: hypothetical protein MZV64_72785 [Ignavibacteriales bacterium]|nr:hypothetical protein [Ignavibacteriales bacterium]